MAGYKIVIRRDLESGTTAWEPTCPLLVEAAQVSRDTDTGKAFLQARVRNVSAEKVTGYAVRFDVGYEGHEPEGLRASKLDTDLAPGASVALKPIPLSHGDADSLEFAVESAKIPGGTWRSTSGPEPIPSTKLEGLSGGALNERNKLIDAMRLKNPDRAKASAIVEGDGWWVCICGTPNVGTQKCSVCGLRKETAEQLCSEESLQKLAAKREENELKESAKRRKTRVLAIVGATAAVLLAGILVAVLSGPGAKYDRACSLYDEGKFEEARAVFEEIPDYKNTQEWLDAISKQIGEDTGASQDQSEARKEQGSSTVETSDSNAESGRPSQSSASSEHDPILGEWTLSLFKSDDEYLSGKNSGFKARFFSDGSFAIIGGGEEFEGTWSSTGDTGESEIHYWIRVLGSRWGARISEDGSSKTLVMVDAENPENGMSFRK